jgi:hypothetical protein
MENVMRPYMEAIVWAKISWIMLWHQFAND